MNALIKQAVVILAVLVVYDMFVKKMILKESYEEEYEYEEVPE